MDEQLERLRRARTSSPEDARVAVAYAAALERAGRTDEALAELFRADAPEPLAQIAARHPRLVLEHLARLDYRSARLAIERLVAAGQARHPALIALASQEHGDRVLRRHALGALESEVAQEIADVTPDELATLVGTGVLPGALPRGTAAERDRRERWRGLVHKLIDRAGPQQAVALLPWLVPLLASREPVLAARALAVVRRLTDRDAPPFDVETLAERLLSASPPASEGEPPP